MAVEEAAREGTGRAQRHEGGRQARVEDAGPGHQLGPGLDRVREEGGQEQGAARAEQGEQPAEEGGEVADAGGHRPAPGFAVP